MSIEVGYDEMNIQTTVVLLKAMRNAGRLETPLLVDLSPLDPEEGWRLAAIQYLDARGSERQRGVTRRPSCSLSKSEGDYQELNERWDWEEARERAQR